MDSYRSQVACGFKFGRSTYATRIEQDEAKKEQAYQAARIKRELERKKAS